MQDRAADRAANTGALIPGCDPEELEGLKEIGAALGVSERTAKRLKKGDRRRRPMPTYTNLLGRVCTLRSLLEEWRADPWRREEPAPAPLAA